MNNRNVCCPMCGYECEKNDCGEMVCENPNCKLDREPISPRIWKEMHNVAQFVRDLARENYDLIEKLRKPTWEALKSKDRTTQRNCVMRIATELIDVLTPAVEVNYLSTLDALEIALKALYPHRHVKIKLREF